MGTSGETGNTWEHVENTWEYVGNTETPGYSNGIHEDMWEGTWETQGTHRNMWGNHMGNT